MFQPLNTILRLSMSEGFLRCTTLRVVFALEARLGESCNSESCNGFELKHPRRLASSGKLSVRRDQEIGRSIDFFARIARADPETQ